MTKTQLKQIIREELGANEIMTSIGPVSDRKLPLDDAAGKRADHLWDIIALLKRAKRELAYINVPRNQESRKLEIIHNIEDMMDSMKDFYENIG